MKKIILGLFSLSFTYYSYAFSFGDISRGVKNVYLETKRKVEEKAPEVFDALSEFSEDIARNVEKHAPKVVKEGVSLYKKAMDPVLKHGPEALKEAKRLFLEAKSEIVEDVELMMQDFKDVMSCKAKDPTSFKEDKDQFYPVSQEEVSCDDANVTPFVDFDLASLKEKTHELNGLSQNAIQNVRISIEAHEKKIEAMSNAKLGVKSSQDLAQDSMQELAYSELTVLEKNLTKNGTMLLFNSKHRLILEELKIIFTNIQNNDYDDATMAEIPEKIRELHEKMVQEREFFEENFRKLLQNFYLRLSQSYDMTEDDIVVYFSPSAT